MRLGLLGAGAIARRHVSVLGGQPDVEIAAVCDRDEARARELAGPLGATAHRDWESMLAGERLDALFVCTPPRIHASATIAALGAGIAVYVEKPLARTFEDGEAIVSAWRSSGAVCSVGYQWRSLDVLDELRARLSGQQPGMLISRSITATEGGRGDLAVASAGPGGSWFTDPAQSGGILFELGSHDIDLQAAIAGPAASVQAFAGSGLLALSGLSAGALDDAVVAIIRYAAGGLGAVHIAWTDVDRVPVFSLDVVAGDAAMHLALDPVFRLTGRARGADVDRTASGDPRQTSVARFLQAARAGDPRLVPCSPADALVTLQTALACEQAIATGLRVDL